jgi:uncharacterized protein with HEPN domain
VPPTLADRVRHILAAIENSERFLAGKTEQDYAADYFLRLAIERLLEIICEASRHIPDGVKGSEPGIPWIKLVDFGNRLRHAYHRIDAAIVWSVVTNDLPPLKAFVERIIREEAGRSR